MIFFVIAIEVECVSFLLQDKLQGDARRFLPHISILPRFSVESGNVQALVERAAFTDLPSEISLRGPREMSSQLAWYECGPQDIGFEELIRLHGRWASQLSPFARPDNLSHWGREYRPHLTIRSNEAAGQNLMLPDVLKVRPSGSVLYEYLSEDTKPAKRHLLQGA